MSQIDLDQLIKTVTQILAQRAEQALTVSIEDDCPDESVFLTHQTVILEHVDVLFLKTLVTLDTTANDWAQWFQKGFNYGINFEIRMGFADVNLIPWQLLTKWPVRLISKDQQPIVVIDKPYITYADVMFMKQTNILVKLRKQKLTALAADALARVRYRLLKGLTVDVYGSSCGKCRRHTKVNVVSWKEVNDYSTD